MNYWCEFITQNDHLLKGVLFMDALYEEMRHGENGFHIGVYSETLYGADYKYHEDFEFLYVAEGTLKIGVEDRAYDAPPGSVFFFDRNRPHYVDKTEAEKRGPFHWYAILFDISVLGCEDDMCRIFLENNAFNTRLKPDPALFRHITEIQRIASGHESGFAFRAKSELMLMMAELISSGQYRQRSGAREFSNSCEAVNAAVEYIENNYANKITLDDISAAVGYSKTHLSREFKKYTSRSVIQYLINYRIQMACRELLYSDKTVTRIATGCGFENVSYFNRTFLQQLGMTPMEYRDATDRMYEFSVWDHERRKNGITMN